MADLGDLTSACIRCGFCLESCPTFVIRGEETASPRGRIYLVRSAEAGTISWESVREPLDSCLGCRACEPACPSNVQYGQILELARAKLEREKPNRWRKLLLDTLTSPTKFKLAQRVPVPGWLMAKVSGDPKCPPPPMPRPSPAYEWPELRTRAAIREEVVLLEGCAMRTLFPRVHQATRRLLRRAGFDVTNIDLGCCGALHAHSGHLETGEGMAAEVARKANGRIVVTNSAGCGSWLKDAGVDVLDISQVLTRHRISDLAADETLVRVTYHDACHLAHGQRITSQPRELITSLPGVELIEMAEADRCCGSAGTYNVFQPGMARKLLNRKMGNIQGTGAEVVILGNPGCHAWIAQGGAKVLHLAEFLEARYSGVSL